MRKSTVLSTVLSLFLLVPASITWAQTITQQKGLTTAVFTLPQGKLTIYLPEDIRPGETISGSVSVKAAGQTPSQIEKNQNLLFKKVLQLNETSILIDSPEKSFHLNIAASNSSGTTIQLSEAGGKNMLQATIPYPSQTEQSPGTFCLIPAHTLTGAPCNIRGPFDGNAENTNVRMNGQDLFIIAESKSQCVVFYPENASGKNTLSVFEFGRPECSATISGVQLIVTAGKLDLHKGERTNINVSITGLENLQSVATLRLNNLTTTVVALMPLNNIVITLPPDSVPAGIFNRSFEVQSIRTGSFTVAVDLDLPEHPPTQPQPNEPTQPQCPSCSCSCTATIIPVEEKDGVSTYRVSVTASCAGQFGPPPCKTCGIVDAYAYEWQVSFSAGDGIESVGPNDGSRFSFKNPKKAPFTLTINVTVTCSDGSKCTCRAETRGGPPTTTVGQCPGCQCECDVKIKLLEKQGDNWIYAAIVNAVCTGEFGEKPPCEKCSVLKYDYVWTMPKGEGDVARLAGGKNGQVVMIKPIKKGKFTLHVVVTITCKDNHTCTCEAEIEDEVLDDGCILTWTKSNLPRMTGGLDPSCMKPPPLRRDDFIALKATGNDEDNIQFYCTSVDCPDISSAKFLKLSGMVRFEWKMDEEGPVDKGHFVKLGCWPGAGRDAIGNQVIFQPPVLPLPKVKGAIDTSAITTIILSVIDDNPSQPIDKEIHRTIRITTKRTVANPDFYEVIIIQDKPDEEEVPKFTIAPGSCDVIVEKWKDFTPLNKPTIKLPAGAGLINNNKLLSGEWIQLEADEQVESDFMWVHCNSKNGCKLIRDFKESFADALEWEWTVKEGDGVFVGSKDNIDKGRFVIYEAPKTITEQRDVTITVKVYNPSPKFDDSNPGLTGTIRITIYPAGVKLDYPPAGWLPDPGKPAILKSYLVYKVNNGWQPAFEHNCRIQFFELLDISNEPGTCLNSPARLLAKTCRDFKLIKENGLEVLIDSDSSRNIACDKKGYYMQARTEAPVREYSIKVYAEDYGANGFLRSFANINKGGEKNIEGQLPYYQPVPVQNEDVSHPEKERTDGGRPKRMVYPDNRVNMPKDIDENRIPDDGWIIGNIRFIDFPPDVATYDTDNAPVGDGWVGDGLTFFEEYRGFMVIKPTLEHRRTSPLKKDLFVENKNDLPVDEFVRITTIPVHEIRADQYSSLDPGYFDHAFGPFKKKLTNQRFINFNFGFAHDVNQKGLFLVNEIIRKKDGAISNVLGVTPSSTDEADDNAHPAPPNWNIAVRVDREKIRRACNLKNNDALIFETKLSQVVAHELCHSLNVSHHGDDVKGLRSGDPDCIMRYDNYGVDNEVPGRSLCNKVWGTEAPGRGNCVSQLRVSGRVLANTTHGYPNR